MTQRSRPLATFNYLMNVHDACVYRNAHPSMFKTPGGYIEERQKRKARSNQKSINQSIHQIASENALATNLTSLVLLKVAMVVIHMVLAIEPLSSHGTLSEPLRAKHTVGASARSSSCNLSRGGPELLGDGAEVEGQVVTKEFTDFRVFVVACQRVGGHGTGGVNVYIGS
jgi:hypothetical protein